MITNLGDSELVKLTIEADYPDTRTYINEANSRVEWSEGDKIVVFENNNYKESSSATINGGKATFGVAFSKDNSSSSFTYNAIYPTTSYISDSSVDVTNVVVQLHGEQNATATSFDPAADLLIAKQQTVSAQATSLSMQFKRMVALTKMNIKGLPAGTTISEVKFTASGKILAGKSVIDLSSAKVTQQSNYSKEESIVVKYASAVSATTPIYFNCYPTTIAAGETFSLTVTTNNGSFTKDVTIGSGKSLRFEEGNLSTFTVDMTGISAGEEKEYKVGEIYNENGVKGLIFAFNDKAIFDSNYENIIGYITYGYIMSLDEGYEAWSTEDVRTNCYSSGAINTSIMLELGADKYPAAKWCANHGDGWFLPSHTEMGWMWDMLTGGEATFSASSVAKYNKILTDNGGDAVEEAFYWTSNEIDDKNATTFAFMDRSVVCDEPYKYKQRDIRAVYMFEYKRTYND